MKIFWRMYAWLFVLLTLLYFIGVYVATIFKGIVFLQDIFWWSISLVVSIISIVGVFCFAYHKTVLTAFFWRAFFVFLVGWEIIYPVAIGLTGDIGFKSLPTSSIIKLFVIACLMFPQYVAIFLYAWGDTRKRETKSGKEKKG